VPEVQGNGNDSKIAFSGSAGGRAGVLSRVLRNLSAWAPSITSISPSSTTTGGNQFLLTVNGNDFRRDSLVSWKFRLTTFISGHQLVATITATDIAQPGTVLVFVFNPPEGGTNFISGGVGVMSKTSCSSENSNAVSFTINPVPG
jgi:hypothetical protein